MRHFDILSFISFMEWTDITLTGCVFRVANCSLGSCVVVHDRLVCWLIDSLSRAAGIYGLTTALKYQSPNRSVHWLIDGSAIGAEAADVCVIASFVQVVVFPLGLLWSLRGSRAARDTPPDWRHHLVHRLVCGEYKRDIKCSYNKKVFFNQSN